MALQPGEIIDGKYRIVGMVGEGGMGAVYEGENTRIKRRVAIKVLHAGVAEKVDVVQRFEREAQAAGRIGNEHIVEVLDLGNLPSGERFMVMEFLIGDDLTTRIKKRKRLTPDECVPILHQVLEGLGAAHAASIIHRDLKPDNIFILDSKAGRSDFVKILDFGVSKFSALDNEMSMTRTGAVMGTPYYMSPEQAKGGKVDNRSDLYAIGVVLYQMVTGRVPFNASSFNELLFKIALESPEPIETIVPDCPTSFTALVNKAMSRDPAQRFQSAKEFQEAIAKWQMTMGGASSGSGTEAFPQVQDVRGQMASGQMAPAPYGQANPAMQQSSPSHPGATGPYQVPQMQTPMQLTPIPGTNPALGLSTSSMALTPTPKTNKGGMVLALITVAVAIMGAGAFGAYILTKDADSVPAPATTSAPEETSSEETAEETAAEETDPAPAESAEEPAPAESVAVPEETAKPVDVPKPKPATKHIPKPRPKSQPQPKPDPKPADPPKPVKKGRDIKTEL
jgi:serine/threonine protein kinase